MAVTATSLYRGAAATSSTTLYTTTANTVVTNIVVANTAASSATFTLTLDGVAVLSGVSIAANTTVFFDLKQVLASSKLIAGYASATTVNFHVSGVLIV
jgi:hypothetical protein